MFVSQMWRRATFCIGYLIPYVAWGILLVVLALALYDLLKAGAPAVAQIATAIGLIWAGLNATKLGPEVDLYARHHRRSQAQTSGID